MSNPNDISNNQIAEAWPSGARTQTGPSDPLDLLTSKSKSPFQESRIPFYNSTQPPANFSLSYEDQAKMTKSIKDIFKLDEQSSTQDQVMGDADNEEPEIDLDDQRSRTESLRSILSPLTQLWWSGYQDMDLVTESLADGSRDPSWRIPLGEAGILDFYLDLLRSNNLQHPLKIHLLRLVGNSCADRDENRAKVIASQSLPLITRYLKDPSLLPFAIPVLYNICVDYEPAQQQASDAFLSKELVELISSSLFNESRAFLGYTCKILDLLITRPSEFEVAPQNSAIVLLKIAADREDPCDMEDFLALVNTAIAYMQNERFQKALITQGGLDTALTVMVDSYTRFDSHPSIGVSSPDQDDAKSLSQMRSNLNQVLSDVSALPEFKEACPVISSFTSALRRWLSSPQLQLQVCACIMLGNLARSDAACEEFVHTSQVHKPLIAILTDANDSQLLHAAVGFLKNLALPAKNKQLIGDAGIFDILPRLWHLDTLQQIQFSTISLARQLIIDKFENVKQVCKRLSEDEDSPAHDRTNLSFLIALFDRTDVEHIKMEIARLITAVCRVFNTYTERTPEQMEKIRIKFFRLHPDVGRPLGFMVSQKKWPVVRSEGWFVFALMARYPEGAKCISDIMSDVTVFQPLVELLTGKDLIASKPELKTPGKSPGDPAFTTGENQTSEPIPHTQAAEMNRIDRENAVVLVSEMLKNRGGEMALLRKSLFEDLLRGGGELVISYRESKLLREENVDLLSGEPRERAGFSIQDIIAESVKEL